MRRIAFAGSRRGSSPGLHKKWGCSLPASDVATYPSMTVFLAGEHHGRTPGGWPHRPTVAVITAIDCVSSIVGGTR
jgi:hypothetical protein